MSEAEARAALEAKAHGALGYESTEGGLRITEGLSDIMEAADAYAQAARLEGHVGACSEQNETPDLPPATPVQDYKCPDGSEHDVQVNYGPGDIRELSNCSKCGALNESVAQRRKRSKMNPQHCGEGWYCLKAPNQEGETG